jgi:hypothetical protein
VQGQVLYDVVFGDEIGGCMGLALIRLCWSSLE